MKWILKLHKTAHFAHLSWGYFQHRCYPDCFGFTFCPYWTTFTLQIVIVFAFLLSFCFFLFLANQLFFWMSSHVSLWSNVSFYFAVLINLIVAFFYPFSSADAGRLTCLLIHLIFTHPWVLPQVGTVLYGVTLHAVGLPVGLCICLCVPTPIVLLPSSSLSS